LKKRYLITTADERAWKFDQPVIFLGEWCRLYDRKHIWQDMDAIVAKPYGIGVNRKDFDNAEARAIENKLFPEFCRLLNKIHGMQHDEKFWRIVLGHWFRRSIEVLFNRINTLEQCLQTFDISGYTAYSSEEFSLAVPDSNSAVWAFNNEVWNWALTSRILCLSPIHNFPIVFASKQGEEIIFKGVKSNYKEGKLPLSKKIINFARKQLFIITRLLVKETDAFVINSYLPFKDEIKLELALGQCPQKWFSPRINVVEPPNRLLRAKLTELFASQSKNNKEKLISTLLFELLPICFLEGFPYLNQIVYQQPWPKSPKFIFTSNNFDTDEIFKLWTAMKVESGSKYFVGQHGTCYGNSRYMNPSIDEITSDKYITWGWSDNLPQHNPAFVLKTAGRKVAVFNPFGDLLLIETCLYNRITTWDASCEFVEYFNDQIKFIRSLANKPRQLLNIRLHAEYRYLNWNELSRWHDFDPTIKLDKGESAIKNLIADSRLVVHSYDSTGILETLSLNIPTLAFWQNGFEHLRESAKPYYQILVDAEIVHFSSESVGKKVNEVWDDVDGWWRQPKVQVARKQFCDRFAKNSDNPIHELMQIFLTE